MPNAPTLDPIAACSTGANDLGGVIFRDFNADGRQDSGEPGFTGTPGPITVTAYDDAGTAIGSTLVQTDGSYVLAGIFGASNNIRLEFSDLPDTLQSGPAGSNSGTTVQFHAAPSCTANLAVNVPCEYCQTNPKVAYSRYESGTGAGTNSGNGSIRMIPDDHSSSPVTIATFGNMGSIWSISYDQWTKQLYGAAFLKRHVGLGPRGLDGIYVADLNGASPTLAGGFDLQGVTASNGGTLDLGSVTRTGTNYALSDTPSTATVDLDAFAKVGTVGWGGIDNVPGENTLWLVNLNQRTIVTLDLTQATPAVTNPNTVDGSAVRHYNIVAGGPSDETITGAPTCTNGTLRPFAIKVTPERAYLGAVCDAASSSTLKQPSELIGYVLSFDPTNPTAFTEELSFGFDYAREPYYQMATGTNLRLGTWQRWMNTWSDSDINANGTSSDGCCANFRSAPSPMLSDIELTPDGSMVLGITDRFGHQTGWSNRKAISNDTTTLQYGSVGDILYAQKTDSGFLLEEGQNDPGDPVTPGSPAPGYSSSDSYGNNGEFFYGDAYKGSDASHHETAAGGVSIRLGSNEVVMTAFDPTQFNSQGLKWLSTATGAAVDGYATSTGTNLQTFGKAAGMGDAEYLCDPAPLEIGNYVWTDSDMDGIQDPSEEPLPGVTVSLYDITGTLLVTTTTSNDGAYYFIDESDPRLSTIYSVTVPAHIGVVPSTSTVGGLLPNTAYQVRIDTTQSALAGYKLTAANVDGGTTLPDAIDSDGSRAGNFAVIELTTGNAGDNDHTLDFGFWPTVSVGNRVWYDTNNDGLDNDGSGNAAGSSTGIADVVLALYYDSDGNGSFDGTETFLTSTTTSSEGYYHFTELTPTTSANTAYIVVVSPSNFTGSGALVHYVNSDGNGASAPGPDDNQDQDDNGDPLPALGVASKAITLTPGDEPTLGDDEVSDGGNLPGIDANGNQTLDFGFYKLSVGNYIWEDYNNNGQVDAGEPALDGVAVALLDPNGTVLSTTVTSGGYYTFTGLISGTYVISVTPPSPAYVSSTGQTTDDSGNNTDHGAPVGAYIVSQPFALTPGGGGDTNESSNSDTGTTTNFNLDFGLWQPLSLGNRVWRDEGDGVGELNNGIDDSEPGLAGVVLQLLDGNGTPLLDGVQPITTTTDANGYYTFTNLISGTYRVRIVDSNFNAGNALAGYVSSDDITTTDDPDNNENRDDNGIGTAGSGHIDSATITLHYNDEPNGKPDVDGDDDDNTNLTLDFGFWRPLSLGNLVWRDFNNNGLYEPGLGEVGIPGVTVTLAISGSVSPILTTTTDLNGNYLFTGLVPGNYIVTIPAANFAQGAPLANLFSSFDPTSATNINDDSNDDDNGPGIATGEVSTQPVTLAAGTEPDDDGDSSTNSNLTIDFGFVSFDFGDLPDGNATNSPNYATLLANDGPRHVVIPGLYLGSTEDSESDGQPTATADGDDTNGDDEDGLTFPHFVAGQTVVVTATVVNTTGTDAILYGFIDFNGDGLFDSSETVTQSVSSAGDPQPVLLSFSVPAAADSQQQLGARFRLSHDPSLTATGAASNGEVEDYLIQIERYDLALRKSIAAVSDTPLIPGSSSITYTVNVINQGTMTATEIVVIDTVPSELTYNQADNPGWSATTPVTTTILAPLAPNATATVTLVLRLPVTVTSGTITNTAEIFSVLTENGLPFLDVDSTPDGDPNNDGPVTDDEINNTNDDEDDHDIAVISVNERLGSIGDTIWFDADRSGGNQGTQGSEPGLPGVAVHLTDSLGNVLTTTTDSTGYYLFDNLPLGTYTVTVITSTLPVTVTTSPTFDADGGTDSRSVVTIDSTTPDDRDQDFSYPPLLGSIGDTLWFDADRSGGNQGTQGSEPGLPGVAVHLTDSLGNVLTTTTDSTGYYLFDNLPLGTYTVTVITSTLPVTVTTSPTFDADGGTDSHSVVTIDATTPDNRDQDFSYPPLLGSIIGSVWLDENRDGFHDSNEQALAGITVILYNSDNQPIATVVTSADGTYSFADLPPGSYSLEFVRPDGYGISPHTDDNGDPNADPLTGRTPLLVLMPGQQAPVANTGFYLQPANLDEDHEPAQNNRLYLPLINIATP
ncbi:MAG: carboxypeptidase regulatory-like domain-containing protein [Caldilineaceae bacterium]|nr:carboxypeptidase regulatory-like domain-containing protein [Caldilineaceae bacterium]